MDASLIPFMRSHPSLVSQVSVPEPMMPCLDPYCTYPFGATCESCKLEPDSRAQRQQQLDQEARSNEWIEGLSTSNSNIDLAEQLFFDGTSDRNTIAAVNKEQRAESLRDNDDADSEHSGAESETQSLETVVPYPSSDNFTESSFYPHSPQTNTSHSTQGSNRTTLSATLNPWLSTLFDHTLAGHVSGVEFVGGADEENPSEDLCPLCFNPSGDLRDQHLLRCQYAHDEREREERAEWLLVRGAESRTRR